MTKLFLTGVLCLLGMMLGGCLPNDPPTASVPVGLNFTPQQSLQDKVRSEIAAQRMGDMAYQKFKLTQTAWACFENCPGRVSLQFSEAAAGKGDLAAKVNWLGGSYSGETYLFPGYKLSLKGGAAFPCTMVTLDYLQCRIFNKTTGVTDTLGLKRQL